MTAFCPRRYRASQAPVFVTRQVAAGHTAHDVRQSQELGLIGTEEFTKQDEAQEGYITLITMGQAASRRVSCGSQGALRLEGCGAKAGLPLPRRDEQAQDGHAPVPRHGAGVIYRLGLYPRCAGTPPACPHRRTRIGYSAPYGSFAA